jgi:hypothetical protein
MDEWAKTALTAFLGLGWLSTAAGWWKERSARRDDVMTFAIGQRNALDGDASLLRVVQVLKLEHEGGDVTGNGMSPDEMRRLPAFLEPIGTHLLNTRGAPNRAFELFAKEVLLCRQSKALWVGEDPPCNPAYWKQFRLFGQAMEERGFKAAG